MAWFGLIPEKETVEKQVVKINRRRFDGAIINRLTASWLGTSQSIDQELRGSLEKLRDRSRDLANNNDFVKKFLQMVENNVVGPNGFNFQSRVEDKPGQPDDMANNIIEAAFADWSKKGICDISGRMSLADLERAAIRAVARDGEVLIREVRGKSAGNKYHYALQLIDIARLATEINQDKTAKNNAIVMGVEVNDYGRPIAYHLFKMNQGDRHTNRKTERIPADEIHHLFKTDRPEQTRGYPWVHSAMVRLHHLKGYEEAAVIAARVGASKMGFFTTPDGDASPLGEEEEGDSGEFVTSADAGEFSVLPKGYDFTKFDPDYPHQQYPEFIKATLRGIASGLGVSYHSLANDLEGVNYSSSRAGIIEERDHWMGLQNWFVSAFLDKVFEGWLESAMMANAITMPGGSALPAAKLDKFMAHQWQGRRWTWVDPLKDIQAARLAVKSGVSSPQKIAAQMGMDVSDVLSDIKRFEDETSGLGLIDYEVSQKADAVPVDATEA